MDAPQPSRKAATDELLPTRPTLLARLRNRNDSRCWHRSWEEFFTLYHPVIFRFACNSGLPADDAENVVQEVVIGVAEKLPEFRYDPAQCSFKKWLFRIARNKVVDRVRQRASEARGPLESAASDDDAVLEVADASVLTPDQAWDAMFERHARQAALNHVTQRVKPMTMRLYLHHVVDGQSVEETVAYFRDSQVTPDAVYLAKHRVQKMVDEALAKLREGKTLG